ncbi:MAG: pantetheine-phosphate adenylyltransferase [Anaerolineae bacterium]|jgi:pantetheine-phosphate adenylyltransferase|nr:pantetheine-phosphate adenylyltransferase [Anaerolineae bacterium]
MVKALFPGTFDPIHYGHIDIALRATKLFPEVVIAVYDKPLKNALFDPEDRIALTKIAFKDHPSIRVVGYCGLTVNYCHEIGANVIVRGLRVFSDFEYEFRIALANHRLAPEIEMVALMTNEEHTFLSSSTVREIASHDGDVSSMVPKHVMVALKKKYKELRKANQDYGITTLRD